MLWSSPMGYRWIARSLAAVSRLSMKLSGGLNEAAGVFGGDNK